MLFLKKNRKRVVLAGALVVAVAVQNVLPGNMLIFAKAATSVEIETARGWSESVYAQISGVSDADVTGVSYTGMMSGSLTGDDFTYLVRDYNGGVRIDIPGLKAGTYTINVTTNKGDVTKSGLKVEKYDRSGYAHYNYTEGVGAYNDDGTVKSNAKILYVTDENKETVSVTSKDGTKVTGIGNILNSAGGKERTDSKGNVLSTVINTNQDIIRKLAEDGTPLVVRFIGNVTAPEGLTKYNSSDYGGSVGDNGYMARMQSGKDITLEGIGSDATINGWGFHFIAQSAYKDYGKSFEARNISFRNVPEDCLGMEGVQDGTTLKAAVERCWVHNCSFYVPSIANPAESDKAQGDGACDFKRGQYFTNSYCYYEGYHKTNLVGSSDSSLQYNLTYHHNYWKNCEARGPLGRQANMHFYNNLYENQINYAMNTRANAYIFSEYNMFYMTKSPQRVDAGAIKSYHDSFSSCIEEMGGTIVTDKNTKVTSGNKYENFDTNSSLSYIPSGDYELQQSVTEARKVIYSKTGVMKENPVNVADVTMKMLSYVPSAVTPTNITSYPYESTNEKITKTVKAFTLNSVANVTVSYASDTLLETGVLVNEAGEALLTGSGTVNNLPAGTYMIQPMNFQPGSSTTSGTFKSVTINSLNIVKGDAVTTAAPVKTSEPVATTVAPVKTSEPVATTAAPVKTSEPVATTAASVKTSEPVATTVAPVKTSEPVATTAAPVKTSEPVATTVASVKTSGPVATTVAPVKTSEPVATTVAPVQTSEPVATTVAPVKTSEPVATTAASVKTSEPVATTVAPAQTSAPSETTTVTTTTNSDKKIYVHIFTINGIKSAFFKIKGRVVKLAKNVLYNKVILTKGLKMNKKASISFKATHKGKLTLVFNKNNATCKINGRKYKAKDKILKVNIKKGNVKIKKTNSTNIVYMKYTEISDD